MSGSRDRDAVTFPRVWRELLAAPSTMNRRNAVTMQIHGHTSAGFRSLTDVMTATVVATPIARNTIDSNWAKIRLRTMATVPTER
jgi:hypothetical protein